MSSVKYYNYVVAFSDGLFKTGITSKPFFRLQDYIQEAHRHSLKIVGYQITAPSSCKSIALKIETEICKRYAMDQVLGHREWFRPDDSWMNKATRKKLLPLLNRSNDFLCFVLDMERYWDKHNLLLSTKYRLKIIKNPYIEMIELAKELGKCGNRIKAKLATELTSIGVVA